MRAKEFIVETAMMDLSPQTIHKLADRKGVKWDNEPSFLRLTKRLTGKEHLDDLDQTGLNNVKKHLDKLSESNVFTDARMNAIKAGKKVFKVHGKTYNVTGDITDELEAGVDETFISETAMMGKIADSGKIIRILKKAHTVPFSDEKNWLLVDTDPGKGNSGLGIKWIPADTRFEWVRPYKDSVDENFTDGKNPQDKGDSKRHGINTKASVSSLRKTAKQGGRKGQLAHWLANMKAGRAKKKKTNEATVATINIGDIVVILDDHALDRQQQRDISDKSLDAAIHKLKFPRVIKQMNQIEDGNRFYVMDHTTNVALGIRKLSNNRYQLKTVFKGRPADHNIAGIITV